MGKSISNTHLVDGVKLAQFMENYVDRIRENGSMDQLVVAECFQNAITDEINLGFLEKKD